MSSRPRIARARMAAFHALHAISAGEVDLGEALGRFRDPLSDVRDRALATELVTGVLRWRAALDYQLSQRAKTPLARMDPPVLDSLRLGAYQLLHLERVPVSAAVDDSVELVKRSGVASARTFVNGVLRRLARERGALMWPERPPSDADADLTALATYFAVVHSHPEWLVARWIARLGVDATETWLRFNNHHARLTLAPNRLRHTRDQLRARLEAEGIPSELTAIAPHGLLFNDSQVLSSSAFERGDVVVQDEASQVIPELVQASSGSRVLDACAAPGGKTLALAADVGPSGLVIAADVRPHRLRLLAATLARTRPDRVRVVRTPDEGPLPFRDVFDRVLVDAPCSGLGTVRRDPDIRWRRVAADLPGLASAQVALLDRVSGVVAPGGRIVYSTCSSEPEENEHVVAAFLAAHPAFAVVPLTALDGLAPAIAALATPEGYLQTSPLSGLEAFFGAVLERSHRPRV
jgi:16S rRNA (cytosine967-C5)-methyltransferase